MTETAGIQAALFGIRENLRQFEETARRLAAEAPGGDLAGDLVGLITAKHGVSANVKAARAADEMIGTLLDIVG